MDVPVIPAVARVTYQSMFDAETKLPGWPLLIDRTAVALARAGRTETKVLVVVLDDIRPRQGVSLALREVARVIEKRLRNDDVIARVGDHTLVVVCNEIRADADAAQIARRLVAHAGVDCGFGISLGHHDDDAQALLTAAVRDAQEATSAA